MSVFARAMARRRARETHAEGDVQPTPVGAIANADLGRRLLAEFVGTTLLVIFGAGALVAALDMGHGQLDYAGLGVVGISFALVVAAVVSMFGTTRGAHINPDPSVTGAGPWNVTCVISASTRFAERYVEWREECETIASPCRRWARSRTVERDLAFATYHAALDREETTACAYGLVAARLGRSGAREGESSRADDPARPATDRGRRLITLNAVEDAYPAGFPSRGRQNAVTAADHRAGRPPGRSDGAGHAHVVVQLSRNIMSISSKGQSHVCIAASWRVVGRRGQ